jgi:hypothetical protein
MKAIEWISINYWWVAIIVAVLINILNAVSKHWSQCQGVKKVTMFITEVLSILTSAGATFGKLGKFKPPIISVSPTPKEEKK